MGATWNIFVFPLKHISHSAGKLPVHKLDLQNIVFEDGHEDEALENARIGGSKA